MWPAFLDDLKVMLKIQPTIVLLPLNHFMISVCDNWQWRRMKWRSSGSIIISYFRAYGERDGLCMMVQLLYYISIQEWMEMHTKQDRVNMDWMYRCVNSFLLKYQIIIIIFQIGNVPSTLCIVDYAHEYCGSVHDASAFESTEVY